MELRIEDWGLCFTAGSLEFISSNAEGDIPGSFVLRLPLGPAGLLHIGWEGGIGLDWYRLTSSEAKLLRITQQRVRDLMADPASWWNTAPEPSDGDLNMIEALMEPDGVAPWDDPLM